MKKINPKQDTVGGIIAHDILRGMKTKVILGDVVKVTPGKRHVWVNSNVGVIRKSADSV